MSAGNTKKVFVCGHSYGGLTMLFANPAADAISFWDSAFDPWTGFWRDTKIDLNLPGLYGLPWCSMQLVGAAMVAEAEQLDSAGAAAMAAALNAPSQIIVAGKSGHQNSRAIFDHHPGPKDFQEISEATHRFVDGLIAQLLFDVTARWFDAY